MPYTPPSQRSPATSPAVSRRPSYQHGQDIVSPPSPRRPELPRSSSYMNRHRRTPSVQTASLTSPSNELSESTPPGTADSEMDTGHGINAHGSLRQSPPPITADKPMPTGAVISPPDSAQNSGDEDEGGKDARSQQLESLEELKAAISVIEQRRDGSPERAAADAARANQALALVMPAQVDELKPAIKRVEQMITQAPRKIAHLRSNTTPNGSALPDFMQNTTSETPSDEDAASDGEVRQSGRKPPMLRKKSGELVRPALRPASARRRPSSMPGTPTYSKAVHFDSHLEHVRHFLQVDRPLAVSATTSPTEAYESDTEFPFGDSHLPADQRSPAFEWEIVVSNFPADTPARLAYPVRVERIFLSADNNTLIGTVAVANIAFQKLVVARFTLDYWKTVSEVTAEFNNDVLRRTDDGYDRFNFNIKLADQANLESKTMFLCIKYCVNGTEYWDNNNNTNFQVDFKKKFKAPKGKQGARSASHPANGLPRSNKKSVPASSKPMTAAFDDFGRDFDSKYNVSEIAKQPVHHYLGETPSSSSLRLKGVNSAVDLTNGNPNRWKQNSNSNQQNLSNRYDFGASLSAAIKAASDGMGPGSLQTRQVILASDDSPSPRTMPKNKARSVSNQNNSSPFSGSPMDSPRPTGVEKPVLASDSYTELLNKYCFYGSAKNSPQLVKNGSLGGQPAQFDGSSDFILGSDSPSPSPQYQGSPLSKEVLATSPIHTPARSQVRTRSSVSPARVTGFASGMSPMYPYSAHNGSQFTETYSATAIRG